MDLLVEVRYLVRSFLRNPGYSSAATLTLALGIFANIVLFLLVNAVFFRPLPYAHDETLAMLWSFPSGNSRDARPRPVSYGDFVDWQRRSSSFEDMAAYNIDARDLTDGDVPENVAGAVTTPNFFSVLGVKPFIGPGFNGTRLDDQVIILGYGLWLRRYQGDMSIVGKKITLSGRPYTVVGVLPSDFEHPEPFWDRKAEFWTPMAASVSNLSRDRRFLRVVGRMRPGISMREAQAEMDRIGNQLQQEAPQADSGFTVRLVSIRDQLFGEFHKPLLLLLAGAVVVLLIACANVTNLQLARAISKEREILIRNALGALPGRIFLAAWAESSLLAVIGATIGFLLAVITMRVFLVFNKQFAIFDYAKVDWHVTLFAGGIIFVVGLLTSIVPITRVVTVKLRGLVNLNVRDSQSGPTWRRVRGILVGAQLSLVLPLLIISILLGRSFYKLVNVDPGFASNHLFTFRLSLPASHYSDPAKSQRFFVDLTDRLRAIPGVRSVALSSGLPLTSLNVRQSRGFTRQSDANQMETGAAYYRVVDQYFFTTMGIPLIAGRVFAEGDGTGGIYTAVINESFAKAYWNARNPLGKTIRIDGLQTNDGWVTVVGVVGNVHYDDLTDMPAPEFYVLHNEDPWRNMAIAVRAETPPAALLSTIRSIVGQEDPLLPLSDVQTMQQIIFNATLRSRFALLVVSIASGLAFLLALAGVSSLVAYVVADRSREFGVRMALGAQSGDIMRLVLGYGTKLAILGLSVGIVTTLVMLPVFSHFVYGVQTTDIPSFVAAALLLLLSVLAACYIPGRRAAFVEPASSLRID